MFAIIETGGKQYRVAKGDTIVVDQLGADEGSKITIDRVLLVADKDVKVGTPVVEGAKVTAKVVDHHKGKKVTAFKYRPRQRYRRKVGYRHSHTTLEITGIKA